jgi:hypothetical protein
MTKRINNKRMFSSPLRVFDINCLNYIFDICCLFWMLKFPSRSVTCPSLWAHLLSLYKHIANNVRPKIELICLCHGRIAVYNNNTSTNVEMFCHTANDTTLAFAERIPFVYNVPGVFFCLTLKAEGREGGKRIHSDFSTSIQRNKVSWC